MHPLRLFSGMRTLAHPAVRAPQPTEARRLYGVARGIFERCEASAVRQFGAAAEAGEDTGPTTPAWLRPGGAQGYMGPGNPAWTPGMYTWLETAVNHSPELMALVEHPTAAAVIEAQMGPDVMLASAVGLRWCRPGDYSSAAEGAPRSTLHADWPTYRMTMPWPEHCTGMQVFFCLTDFTEANGPALTLPRFLRVPF